LIGGGKDPVGDDFYNTAFVISPEGDLVFNQPKAVPIQFFADGLPAPEIKVWESPWGKIGICTCYDLSYTRVTDQLIRQGALAIINPTMDMIEWGESQHRLHARVPPVRAAEYGVPIFRVASSGVSLLIGSKGEVVNEAPFGGDEAVIGGAMHLGPAGHLPFDRWLAPLCTALSAVALIFCFIPGPKAKPGGDSGNGRSQTRNPSTEPMPNPEPHAQANVRRTAFGLVSAFGFRSSVFPPAPAPNSRGHFS
jgi:apolipoprotein N-acyltransferase